MGRIGRGCSPTTPRHFWVIFGKSHVSVKNIFCKNRPHMAALAEVLEAKCSYFDPLSFMFSPQPVKKYSMLREDVCIWHVFSWKSDFSFRGFPELILHKNTSTSRRGARPQALFISETWHLKKIKCVFQLEMQFLDLPPPETALAADWKRGGGGRSPLSGRAGAALIFCSI